MDFSLPDGFFPPDWHFTDLSPFAFSLETEGEETVKDSGPLPDDDPSDAPDELPVKDSGSWADYYTLTSQPDAQPITYMDRQLGAQTIQLYVVIGLLLIVILLLGKSR